MDNNKQEYLIFLEYVKYRNLQNIQCNSIEEYDIDYINLIETVEYDNIDSNEINEDILPLDEDTYVEETYVEETYVEETCDELHAKYDEITMYENSMFEKEIIDTKDKYLSNVKYDKLYSDEYCIQYTLDEFNIEVETNNVKYIKLLIIDYIHSNCKNIIETKIELIKILLICGALGSVSYYVYNKLYNSNIVNIATQKILKKTGQIQHVNPLLFIQYEIDELKQILIEKQKKLLELKIVKSYIEYSICLNQIENIVSQYKILLIKSKEFFGYC